MSNTNKVELLGFYGSDETHACSAWTSTSRGLTDDKRGRIPDLLTFLATHGHETPFEKSSLHFLVSSEIASHIHLLKHRIGVSLNAESARYKELRDDKYYIPLDWPEDLQEELESHTRTSQALYHKALKSLKAHGFNPKRAKESARFFLPYNSRIDCDVMFNFRSFVHFQRLRNSPHAQVEIRNIAEAMRVLVAETGAFKHSLAAFGLGGVDQNHGS